MLSRVIRNQGDLALYRGDADGAQAKFREAKAIATDGKDHYNVARCMERLGDCHRERGAYDAARNAYQDAQTVFEKIDDPFGQANCIERLGRVERTTGDSARADELYSQAHALYAADRLTDERYEIDLGGMARCDLARAEIAESEGRFALARSYAQVGERGFRSVADRASAGCCCLLLGRLEMCTDTAESERYFRRAKDDFLAVGHFELARAADDAFEKLAAGLAECAITGGTSAHEVAGERRLISRVPFLFDHLDLLQNQLRNAQLALFFDYDGTLTSIVEDPRAATLEDSTHDLLHALAQSVPVAIVSGRDLKTLMAFVRLEGIYYAGSHGFEIHGPHIDFRPDERKTHRFASKTSSPRREESHRADDRHRPGQGQGADLATRRTPKEH